MPSGYDRGSRTDLAPRSAFRSTIPSRGQAPFVGRDAATEHLHRRSYRVSQQFVVLHGPPGVGKSELAREAQSLQHYAGGAFYVSVREAARQSTQPR